MAQASARRALPGDAVCEGCGRDLGGEGNLAWHRAHAHAED